MKNIMKLIAVTYEINHVESYDKLLGNYEISYVTDFEIIRLKLEIINQTFRTTLNVIQLI